MAIKTKSVYEEEGPDEGYRLLIMRIWPSPVPDWYRASPGLLKDWLKKGIPFKEFKARYVKEMGSQKEKIKALAMRSKEDTLTLFCHEKEDTYCHRRILKELIVKRQTSS